MTTEQVAAFEGYVLEKMSCHRVPSLATAVALDGEVVYARGFGQRDAEQGLPATPNTVYGVASVTKSFTAAAIMRLQEDGRLSVGDPVVRYLPEFRTPDPEATRRITLHHFLTHSAGLPPLPSRWFAFARSIARDCEAGPVPVSLDGHSPIDTVEQLMDYLAETAWVPLGPPGAQFSYSNEGYALLGAIIERVSGRPYARFVAEQILIPAGMRRSGFDPGALQDNPEVAMQYVVRTHEGRDEIRAAPVWWFSEVWLAAGGLCSTVTDLLRYLEIYRTGGMARTVRILTEDSVRRMTSPHMQVRPGVAYGYGLSLVAPGHGRASLIEHGGGRKAISAHVGVVRESGLTAATLMNLADSPARQVTVGILNTMGSLRPDTPWDHFGDFLGVPGCLAAYAGEYRSGEGASIQVSVSDDGLIFDTAGKRWLAKSVGEHAFVVRVNGEDRYARFLCDATEHPWALAYALRIIRRIGDLPA